MGVQNQEFSNNNNNSDEVIDFKKMVGNIVSHWYLFFISVIVFVVLAFVYARYAGPTYKINSKITVQDDQSNPLGSKGSSSSLMDFSDLLDMSSNAYNEIDILKSNSLMTEVVNSLQLNVTIYAKNHIKKVELYDDSPFDVKVIDKKDSIEIRNYDVTLDNSGIHLTNSKDDVDKKFGFGQIVHLPQYDLIFLPKSHKSINKLGYRLMIQSVDDKVNELASALDGQKKYDVSPII